MKRTMIFIALVVVVAPIAAFALAFLQGLIHHVIGMESNADEAWLRSWGYSYGVLAGYFIWGEKA